MPKAKKTSDDNPKPQEEPENMAGGNKKKTETGKTEKPRNSILKPIAGIAAIAAVAVALVILTQPGLFQQPPNSDSGTAPQASGQITRSFSNATVEAGGTLDVILTVDVIQGERYYIIDEAPPSGWNVTDAGGLVKDSLGGLKLVMLQDAVDKTYTYTVKAPANPGTYAFSGIYQIDGMKSQKTIAGASSVAVTA